jgi:hypothetical protein
MANVTDPKGSVMSEAAAVELLPCSAPTTFFFASAIRRFHHGSHFVC